MWNPFRAKKIDLTTIEDQLKQDGIPQEKIAEILTGIEKATQPVTEKTAVDYGDFMDVITSNMQHMSELPEHHTLKLQRQLRSLIAENPEVASSIKLYASYIVYGNEASAVDRFKVMVKGDQIEYATQLLDKWTNDSKIERVLFQVACDLVPYGNAFLELLRNKLTNQRTGVAYIPAHTMYVHRDATGIPIAYYQFPDNQLAKDNYSTNDLMDLLSERKIIKFEKDEIIHFSDGSLTHTNTNTFLNLIVVWRYLKLLEQALLIHRLTRARRFMIFFLDVTGKSRTEIRNTVSKFTARLKNIFNVDTPSGVLEQDRSTLPASSDVVIPITASSKTKVQSVPADTLSTDMKDLKFYANRIIQNLFTSHVFATDQTGNEIHVKEAFIRMVKLYQKYMEYGLIDLYEQILATRQLLNTFVLVRFPSADVDKDLKMIDTLLRRMMVVNQLIAVMNMSPPKEWIIDYVFKDLSEFEVDTLVALLRNEEAKQIEGQTSELTSLYETAGTPVTEKTEIVEKWVINQENLEKSIKMMTSYLRMKNYR